MSSYWGLPESEKDSVPKHERRWCIKQDTGRRYWCGPTSPTDWQRVARKPEMTKVTLTEHRNKDGTITRTVKCSLEQVTDIQGNAMPNPIQKLYWNTEEQAYQVYYDDDYYGDYGDSPTTFVDIDTTNNNTTLIEARECWCARVFETYPAFVAGSLSEDASILGYPKQPLYCPVDTNADMELGKGDVRTCTARAIYNREDTNMLLQDSVCFQEEPLSEFARSSWPLTFFWYIVLLYLLLVSQYGKRVKGYIKRIVCLQKNRIRGRSTPTPTPNNNTNTNSDTNNETNAGSTDDHDEERGNVDLVELPSSISSTGSQEVIQNDGVLAPTPSREELIEEEFGSLLNYELLDHDLRQQARATDNEIVTWLWYSAVYSEVKRYRYRQWMNRRNRDDGNTADDSSEDSDVWEDPLRNQRLDSVYWWPPATPDGERWEHLRNRNQRQQPTHDEDGNPLDVRRLALKTKPFVLDDMTENETDSDIATVGNKGSDSSETTDTNLIITLGSSDEDDEIGDNVCSICLCEIEDGELVGDIPCGHYFHKECLKEWLVKNNQCPTCRMPDIASHPIRE